MERAMEIACMLRNQADRPQDVVITGVVSHSKNGNTVSNIASTKEGIRISSRPFTHTRANYTIKNREEQDLTAQAPHSRISSVQ